MHAAHKQGPDSKYYQGGDNFNLRMFWAEHKSSLPVHFSVYVAEVACKKAGASNVETVFSGAGKYMEEVHAQPAPHPTPLPTAPAAHLPACSPSGQAESTGPQLLQRIVRLHYNWKYAFLRPTNKAVCERYKTKFGGNITALLAATEARVIAASTATTTSS